MSKSRTAPRRPPARDFEQEVALYVQDVAEGLRLARLHKRLTLIQLAEQAGVSERHLVEVEAGRNTSLQTIARLCLAMNVAPWGLPVPRSLVGQTVRAAAERLDLDLIAPRPQGAPIPQPSIGPPPPALPFRRSGKQKRRR